MRAKYNTINIVRQIFHYCMSYYNSKIINNSNKSFNSAVSEYWWVVSTYQWQIPETKTTPETKGPDGARYPDLEDQYHEIK